MDVEVGNKVWGINSKCATMKKSLSEETEREAQIKLHKMMAFSIGLYKWDIRITVECDSRKNQVSEMRLL
jgi:hypothetical protein